MLKAIIFDFGNVICKFDNNLFLKKISKYTKKSPEELYDLIYSKSNLPKLYETGLISSDDFFNEIVKLCYLSIPKDVFIESYTNIFSPIKTTFELIEQLSKNYTLALMSNTSEWDFNLGIKPVSIFNLFNTITLSFEVFSMKPDKKIYEDCLKKLNLKANECVYIDDIKRYTDKANEMGMLGIHYTSHKKLLESLQKLNIKL